MDLIDRYLVAVRRQLPPAQQDDIVSELRDSLRSEAEEHEQQSGRPLNEDEQAALLKKRGHPWLMASRYLPQQYLIGPSLYPYYRKAVGMVVFWVVLPITLFGGAINAIYTANPARVWSRVLGTAWEGAIYSVGIVTIVFAILEHEKIRLTVLEAWNPKRLPDPDETHEVPRSESVFGLVFSLTFLVWWTDIVRVPDLVYFDSAPAKFVPAPIWAQLYWPILLSLLSSIAVYLIDMVRPWRKLAVSIVDIGIGLANIVIVTMILRAGTLVHVSAAAEFAEKAARVERITNFCIITSFAVIGIVTAWDVLYQIWRIVKTRPARAMAL